MVGDGQEIERTERDIVLHLREGGLKRIPEIHRAYAPLHYVLMFPRGEDGWYPSIPLHNNLSVYQEVDEIFSDEDEENKSKYVSAMNYFAYRLQIRSPREPIILHRFGRLFQQWIVDMYAIVEQMRLNYLKFNQKKLRADLYSGLVDAMFAEDGIVNIANLGQRIILPSSFTGGPRQMIKLYQDGMAIVRTIGKPDLFITITCNPNWPEITNALLPGQSAQDRPDLCARVFNMKLKVILKEILNEDIFGKVIGYLHTIEFQKRGLPHAHVLIILAQENKPQTVDDYDAIVCAEIPDKNSDPNTYETVKHSMMHGPCGYLMTNAPCMKNGKCSKGYPKHFQRNTAINENGYPIYRCREDGRTITIRGIELDNRWVVPYNPYLTTKYNCHINVEICSSIIAVKYLFKYVYKGHDRATVEIKKNAQSQEHVKAIDEIRLYLDARYVSASEATWRLFHYRLHDRMPNVMRLQVHLPGHHIVTFRDDEHLEDIIERSNVEKTTLTAWFQANQIYPEARGLTYGNFPSQWVYEQKTKEWKPRKRGNTIGRIYFVHPTAGERYYLRMLLNVVCGATSFEDLRTVNGELCGTFKEACAALGLLQNDREWDQCLTEAARIQSGKQLRNLFATLLLFCELKEPEILWENHINDFSEDIRFQNCKNTGNMSLRYTNANICDQALNHLESILNRHGKSLKEFPNMPIPNALPNYEQDNHLIQEEQSYNIEELTQILENGFYQLNVDQRAIFEKVILAVETRSPAMIFVDGPGGTGKTFLYK
jgi:hypothetical protein